MGIIQEKTEGLANVLQLLEKYKDKDQILVLFSGGKNSDGRSWCPDCVSAEPVIEQCLHGAPDNSVFIYCSVGDRANWKNPSNEYRTHPKLLLTSVPTLVRWNTPQRLVEKDCSKADLVKMFFEED